MKYLEASLELVHVYIWYAISFRFPCSCHGYHSAMPRYIMESTHPEHEDFEKPGWGEELLEFCNNYR